MNRTRNLLIWSQTRYHCATDPTCRSSWSNRTIQGVLGKARWFLHIVMAKRVRRRRPSLWSTFLKWTRRESNTQPSDMAWKAFPLFHGSSYTIQNALAIAWQILHIGMAKGGRGRRLSLWSTFPKELDVNRTRNLTWIWSQANIVQYLVNGHFTQWQDFQRFSQIFPSFIITLWGFVFVKWIVFSHYEGISSW